ncbi:hypothetical protein CoNPh27_CDS0019 [Staphylococcus phage S-CoN_Ph27]|nr:hypothetical protein CoNPh27_CDS0019 [Staphylococcus phage S-CoN_Ph27]
MRNRLKEKGLSIRELSKRVDLPYNTVYAIFKGQSNIDGVRLRVYKKIVNELVERRVSVWLD